MNDKTIKESVILSIALNKDINYDDLIIVQDYIEEEALVDADEPIIYEPIIDIDELEEVEMETICFHDKGREYEIIGDNFEFSVIKDMETQRFMILNILNTDYIVKGKTKYDEYIVRGYDCESYLLRDHWVSSYPIIEETWFCPVVEVNKVPKNIRNFCLKENLQIEYLSNASAVIEYNILSEEELEIAHRKRMFELLNVGLDMGISDRIIKSLDIELIENEIQNHMRDNTEDLLLHIEGDFYINQDEDQFVQNDKYCHYLDSKYKIPYWDEYKESGYTIISPTKYNDFAEVSRYMHNCVGQPQQKHAEDVRDEKIQIFFLKKEEKHIATIGVRNKEVYECLGRFNTHCEQKMDGKVWFNLEQSKIVQNWAKNRGLRINY